MTRRNLLAGSGFALLAGATSFLWGSGRTRAEGHFAVTHTDAEWRKILTPAQYNVLRQEGTEMPESSPLEHNFARGRYDCAGCALPLFASDTKFDSGTGWPSFFKPLDAAVETRNDDSLMMQRTEVHCSRCGGHLGHVFDDGPKPTGLRYCMNGVALTFQPAQGV
ncbi:MAG: peptide-methionine (R)-S-oxide reductase MsrB [Rhodospirillales bacterium]